MDNQTNDIRRTQANHLRTIEADVRWFKLAVQRNLLEEAAEIVYDWVEEWLGRQANTKGDKEDLANLAQTVGASGIDVAPYIEAFMGPIADLAVSGQPVNWHEMAPKPSPPAATQGTTRTNDLPAPTPIEQACHAVYEKRRRNAGALQFQRQCETSLSLVLGEVLNHRISDGLIPVTARFSQVAREVYFRELHHKRSLSPAGTAKADAARQWILASFPFRHDNHSATSDVDIRWLREMIYAFHRLIHLWLLRPLMREDFLAICTAEGMDLTRHDLDLMRSARVLKPLAPTDGSAIYHIVQAFAVSSIWPEWSSMKATERSQLESKADGAIESIWEDLALFDPDQDRLNRNRWLALTQEAREKRERIGQQPAQRLWIEGRANLAAALLFAIGIRPIASAGRPRIAPDDVVLRVLDDVALNYYRRKGTIRGCLSMIRKATLNNENSSEALDFFHAQAPNFSTLVQQGDKFILSWREKLGAEKALDRALDELWAAIDGVPDQEQSPGDMFAFERLASQKWVPFARQSTQSDNLTEDVLRYANQLIDGRAGSIACWDMHLWQWWLIPRWILRHRVGHWLIRHVRLPFVRVDATDALTLPI